ncbi:secretion protein HlyD [Tychonema sp. BBK16]|uniref:secretion protein HlyD n=1 Tax=Tychonema sp. BBK16 TaxID=2699888 RepID=UPI001F199E98|nr:secretion protein HlyD [Tychonema sp. BBK16]MCF6374096.1 secretion protein HlyD [Tychonema sp. BBK16]
MTKNHQDSLFTELADAESATVNGAGTLNGISDSNSDINSDININDSSKGINLLFFVPPSSQLYMYDPSHSRPYKTLVV